MPCLLSRSISRQQRDSGTSPVDACRDRSAVEGYGSVIVRCYGANKALNISPDHDVTVDAEDPTAYTLGHPKDPAFTRDSSVLLGNLGRWHVTTLDVGAAGVSLPPR